MRILYSITGLCLLLGIWGCSSYKAKKQESFLTVPELASIVTARESFMYTTHEQVGVPNWETPLKVHVQELPFNKSSYTTYSMYMQRAGRINSVPYVDSLPYKPKYLRLQLLDKIALAGLLNDEINSDTRAYLEKDEAYKMVTYLDITTADDIIPLLLGAETVILEQDDYKNLYLVLLAGDQEQQLSFYDLQVFDYGLSAFCWGENLQYRKEIQAIIEDGETCPEGTFNKASKANSEKDYLKF